MCVDVFFLISRQQVCIRQNPGFCCVQYSVCSNVDMAFTLDTSSANALGDASCIMDFVSLESEFLSFSKEKVSFCLTLKSIRYNVICVVEIILFDV